MNFLTSLFLSDFKNRLLALALAMVTWASVYRESTEQVKATAGLELTHGPDVAILSVQDESGAPCSFVEVTLNGPRGESVRLRDLRLTADIEKPAQGKQSTVTIEVTEKNLLLPPKFRLAGAKPARFRVQVDARERQYKELEAGREALPGEPAGAEFVEGKPAEGVTLRSATISPRSTYIFGPRSVLDLHGKVKLLPVKIDRLSAGIHNLTAEIVSTLDGQPISTLAPITVQVDIGEEPQEAVFTAPITLLQGHDYARDFLAEPDLKDAEVRVRGPASAITELKARPELIMVFVDIAAMRPEECQPVDDKPLNATLPVEWRFRSRFAGSDDVEVTIRKPEKAQSVVTFLRRPPPK
ncbi:MAG: hypothetical protein AAB074_23330 [Planctomycetota bacterium]